MRAESAPTDDPSAPDVTAEHRILSATAMRVWHALPGPLRTALGTLAPGRGHRRERRPWKQALRAWPSEWIMERNAGVLKVMAILMILNTTLGPALGLLSFGWALVINQSVSQVPPAVQVLRMLGHGFVDTARFYRAQTRGTAGLGIVGRARALRHAAAAGWDFTWWARPQMRQQDVVAAAPEESPFKQIDAEDPTLSWLGRKVVAAHHWLDAKVEAPASRPVERAGRWMLGQGHDWLNGRARTPGLVAGLFVLAASSKLGLGLDAKMILLSCVGQIPAVISGIGSWATGDAFIFLRAGVFQRSAVLQHWRRKQAVRAAFEQTIVEAREARVARRSGVPAVDGVAPETPRIRVGLAGAAHIPTRFPGMRALGRAEAAVEAAVVTEARAERECLEALIERGREEVRDGEDAVQSAVRDCTVAVETAVEGRTPALAAVPAPRRRVFIRPPSRDGL